MAGNNLSALWQLIGAQQGIGALDKAHNDAIGRFDTNYYDPFTKAYGGAPQLVADAYGLGGSAGTQRARDAFTTSPGYGFSFDEGLKALDRSAAARGMLGSGNQQQDLLKFGQGIANQEYGKWLTGLGGIADAAFGAAQGQTGRQGTLAGLDMQNGQGQANLWGNVGNNLSQPYQPQPQQGSGIGGAIAGGLQLGGNLLGGPLGGAVGDVTGRLLQGSGFLGGRYFSR
ncbi:MAG: hypothetical protein U1E25_15090 [Methylocystis sp.]